MNDEMKSNPTIREKQLHGSFNVYGASVHSFICSHKMQSAALMLINTHRNILDIAGDVGYDNGSKFAKAFRDVRGVTPKEYQNQNVQMEPKIAQTERKINRESDIL